MQGGVQEWIHKLEEGEGVRYIKLAFGVLVLLTLTALWHIREAKSFGSIEAMDAGQLARNIAEGKGYTTDFVRPLSITLVQRVGEGERSSVLDPSHPDLANAPVYPVLLAGLMKVLPFDWEMQAKNFRRYQPEVLIGIFNQVLFFMALFLTFIVARRLFDTAVAWLAVVILTTTELIWMFTTSGLSTMLLLVLMLLLGWVLVALEQNVREGTGSPRWFLLMALAVGGVLGVMGLTRYSLAFMALPVAGFLGVAGGTHRVKLSIIPVVAMLLIMSPWMLRNYQVGGNVFGVNAFSIYQGTPPFQGNRLERSMPEKLELELNKVEPGDFMKKLALNAQEITTDDLPRLGGNWVSAFFLVALLIPFRNPAISRFRYFVAGSILVLAVVQGLGRTELSTHSPRVNSENLLVLLVPMVFVFGAGLFFVLLDQIEFAHPFLRQAVISAFVLFLALPLILRILPPRNSPFQYPPYHPPIIQQISHWMGEEELIMSDMPWAVAWYGDRQAVWTTLDTGDVANSDYFRISDYQKEIKGLYLTQLTIDAKFVSDILKSEEGAWGRFVLESIIKTNVPSGFPLRKAPPGLFPEQLFLSDQRRWN